MTLGKNSRICGVCVAVAALLVIAPQAWAINLLSNPGFEEGDTGAINGSGNPTDWQAWGPESGWHHNDAGKTIDDKAIKFWWDDAAVWQDFPATAGDDYLYSVMAFNSTGDPLNLWNGLLKAEFYDNLSGSGTPLLEMDIDRYYSASDPVDTWVELSGSVTAPAGAVLGRIILKIADWQESPGGSLNFDNASVVPEPATISLLAVGLACMLRRRR